MHPERFPIIRDKGLPFISRHHRIAREVEGVTEMRVLLDHHKPVTRRERFAQSFQKIPSNIGSFKLSKISNTDKNTGQVNAGKGGSEDDNIL